MERGQKKNMPTWKNTKLVIFFTCFILPHFKKKSVGQNLNGLPPQIFFWRIPLLYVSDYLKDNMYKSCLHVWKHIYVPGQVRFNSNFCISSKPQSKDLGYDLHTADFYISDVSCQPRTDNNFLEDGIWFLNVQKIKDEHLWFVLIIQFNLVSPWTP